MINVSIQDNEFVPQDDSYPIGFDLEKAGIEDPKLIQNLKSEEKDVCIL